MGRRAQLRPETVPRRLQGIPRSGGSQGPRESRPPASRWARFDPIEPGRIYDLDSNIAYYATEDRSAFLAKFGCGTPSVSASDLPADIYLGVTGDVRHLIESFRETGKDLVLLDLTTTDIREIGFHIVRVWSPETLSLSLPSAPHL